MAVVSRREKFVQIGETIINLQCVETIFVDPAGRVIVALTSGRTIELYDEDAVDFLTFLGNFHDIMEEAKDAWEKREREADEPLEGPDW